MCPPHQFSQIPTSGHLCRPAWTRFFAYLAFHGLCTTLHTLLHTSTHLHAPLHTSAHLHTPFHAPLHISTHPCATFCTSLSRASHPYRTFHLTSDPFGYLGQLSPSATGHNAHPWTSVESSPNSVDLHNPHSHPRTLSGWVTIAKVALLFIMVSPIAGLHTLYYHSMAHGQLIPILSGHTFLCNPWKPMRARP